MKTSALSRHALLFNATATTEIYTLSLHDALPISSAAAIGHAHAAGCVARRRARRNTETPSPACASPRDRKSTRLNSSHVAISYAVFCLKKKTSDQAMFYVARIKQARLPHVAHSAG